MGLTNNEINYFVNLTIDTAPTLQQPTYLKKITYVGYGLQEGVFTIKEIGELDSYLEDPYLTEAKRAFEYGQELILWLKVLEVTEPEPTPETIPGNPEEVNTNRFNKKRTTRQTKMDQSFLDSNIELVNDSSFTMFFSTNLPILDLLELNITGFKGVVCYSVDSYSEINESVLNEALKTNRVVFSDYNKDGWGLSLMSYFLNQPSYSNMQYLDKINSTSNVPKPASNWTYLFDNKITHLVESGSLGLFAIGGIAGADVYIQETLKEEIKRAFVDYIGRFKPGYTDITVGKLEDAAYFVLEGFKERGLIKDFDNIVIPLTSLQAPSDRSNFTLSGFNADIKLKSAVWKVNGLIRGV